MFTFRRLLLPLAVLLGTAAAPAVSAEPGASGQVVRSEVVVIGDSWLHAIVSEHDYRNHSASGLYSARIWPLGDRGPDTAVVVTDRSVPLTADHPSRPPSGGTGAHACIAVRHANRSDYGCGPLREVEALLDATTSAARLSLTVPSTLFKGGWLTVEATAVADAATSSPEPPSHRVESGSYATIVSARQRVMRRASAYGTVRSSRVGAVPLRGARAHLMQAVGTAATVVPERR